MNVQTVAEILIDELSKIEAHTKKFEQAASKVEATTNTLIKNPIKVDLSEFTKTLEKHEKVLLVESAIVPKRIYDAFFYMVILFFAFTCVAIFFATMFYFDHQETKLKLQQTEKSFIEYMNENPQKPAKK